MKRGYELNQHIASPARARARNDWVRQIGVCAQSVATGVRDSIANSAGRRLFGLDAAEFDEAGDEAVIEQGRASRAGEL